MFGFVVRSRLSSRPRDVFPAVLETLSLKGFCVFAPQEFKWERLSQRLVRRRQERRITNDIMNVCPRFL